MCGMYELDHSVTQNMSKAFELYHQAHKVGDPMVTEYLAKMSTSPTTTKHRLEVLVHDPQKFMDGNRSHKVWLFSGQQLLCRL